MPETVTTATTTYSVFAPIFFLARANCFLPVRIKQAGQNTCVAWSWLYYGLSVGVFMIMMSWIVFGLIKSYAIDDVYRIRLEQLSGMFITILDDSYLLLTFTTATLIVPFTFKHLCAYLKCLNKVDFLLKRPVTVTREKKKCSAALLVTITLTVLVLGIDMGTWWSHVFNKHVNLWLYLLYNLPFYYTFFLVMVIELNYWYLVRMVNIRLITLNENLTEKYHQYKTHKTVQSVSSDVGNAVMSIDLYAKNISNSIRAYELLYEANTAVNNYYGVNILLVIIGCLIHLLVTPYDLYLELKFKDYTFIFPQFCWMAGHILRLLLVVEPCHTATQEVKRASALLCQFLSLDVTEKLQLQLDILATQLFHCPIQYTAYDLVVLDRTLLTKIAGGVTTYLVILFQFEN